MSISRLSVLSAVAMIGASVAGMGQAATFYEQEGYALGLKVDAMAGAFSAREDYLGEGGKKWREAFVRSTLTGVAPLGQGEAYGALGAVAQGTWGDGDAGGYTNGSERKVSLEDAHLGWREAKGKVDISFGRQDFQLGDGFLIAGDRVNLGKGKGVTTPRVNLDRGGAYYLAARKAFAKTAILRFDPEGPWRGDVFWLASNNPYQQNTELAGVNAEYVAESLGTLGLSYLHVLEVEQGKGLGIWDQRDGMRTVSVRGQGSAGVENLFLSFEYVNQSGGSTPVKNDSRAWYVEAGWTFAQVNWRPVLNYRHAYFSADKPDTQRNEAFDPLFFGLTRGLGTWFQGEVASNYAGPANSGNRVDRIELTLNPREDLSIGLQFWKYGRVGQAPDLAGREIDLFAFWQLNEHLTFVPLLGLYEPRGRDVIALQGNDKRNVYLQGVLMFSY